MVIERGKLEGTLYQLIRDFQNKYECGLKIHDTYGQLVGNRFEELMDIHLEIKK